MGADFEIARKRLTEKHETHKTGKSWVNDGIFVDGSKDNNNKQSVCIMQRLCEFQIEIIIKILYKLF